MLTRKNILFSAIFLILSTVSACSPVYRTNYDYVMPPSAEGRLCANQCQQTSRLCTENCQLRKSNCLSEARRDGEYQYNLYVDRQRRENKEVIMSPSSFYNTYECENHGCSENCTTDMNMCFANCGGEVTSRTICVANCDRR